MAQERKNGSAVAHGGNGATFEQRFLRLQEVVQKLSDGNLTLQEALSSFEEGMMLADSCASMLEEAELRVQQVSERATREGQATALSLDTAMRAQPVEESSDLLTFEVEKYETTLVFEVPEAQPSSPKKKAPASPAKPSVPGPILDPLFDEDE